MKRSSVLLIFLWISTLILALPVAAADPPVTPDSGAAIEDPATAPRAPMTPLEQAINAIRQQAAEQITLLSQQLAEAQQDPARTEELVTQIEQVKFQAEIAVVQVIVEDARAAGDEARLVEAEDLLDRLQNPEKYVTPPNPVERPAPPAR